jgi:hypothetical protein
MSEVPNNQADGAGAIPVYQAGYTTAVALVADAAAVPAGKATFLAVTVAGNVHLTLAGGGTITLPVAVGLTTLPFSTVGLLSSGTTATLTAYVVG